MKLIRDLIGFIFFSFFTVYMFSISGCFDSHPIDKLIKDADLAGATEFKLYDTQVQEGKSINGGILVLAKVNVPFNITYAAVRPTALSALKQLKNQYPDSKWFMLWLKPEGKAGRPLNVNVARTEFENDKIILTYEILSPAKMEELLTRAKNGEEIPNFLPSMEKPVFDLAVRISTAFYKVYKETFDEKASDIHAANEIGITPKEAKIVRSSVVNYYTLGQEHEVIQ